MKEIENRLNALFREYKRLGIEQQIDYAKFYLYSIITHSTAIEGSTVTEVENQLLFDEGISAKGRSISEQLMNLDLKAAYEQSIKWAGEHKELSVDGLCTLSALTMKNTGSVFHCLTGDFDSSKGELRRVNVTAGAAGHSYMSYSKVPGRLKDFCQNINEQRREVLQSDSVLQKYILSFDAHYFLVTIHPWVDGNGRMSRLVMNQLQFEMGLIPTKVSKDNKAAYIDALIASREQDSLLPFREFMLNALLEQLEGDIYRYKQDLGIGEDYDTNSNTNSDTLPSDSDTNQRLPLSNKQKDVINFCTIPRSSREILDKVGVSYHSKNIEKYISSLINAGYLEMTNPENPNASNQKYRNTIKK